METEADTNSAPEYSLETGRNERAVNPDRALSESAIVVPILEEQLAVSTARVNTGSVRIQKVVHEREEIVDELVTRTFVDVERVPINRMVDAPVATRQEGDTTVFSVIEEVVVVTKQYLLREELRVTPRRTEEHHPKQITLRSEEVVVDRKAIDPKK